MQSFTQSETNMLEAKIMAQLLIMQTVGVLIVLLVLRKKIGKSEVPAVIKEIGYTELQELKLLVRQGKKIEAIKRYRIWSACGLKLAKEFIESL